MTFLQLSHLDNEGRPTQTLVGPFRDHLEAVAWSEANKAPWVEAEVLTATPPSKW